jgi:hypothetical protein
MNEEGSCEHCGKTKLVKGTLEGVSFVPETVTSKWLAKGVYGIQAVACAECGRLSDFKLDADTLKKIT